jgi:hypothetical protein
MRRRSEPIHRRPSVDASPRKRRPGHQGQDQIQAGDQAATDATVSPKKALAEAIHQLGARATNDDLAQFAKEQFGLDLQFVLIIPRGRSKTMAGGRVASRTSQNALHPRRETNRIPA